MYGWWSEMCPKQPSCPGKSWAKTMDNALDKLISEYVEVASELITREGPQLLPKDLFHRFTLCELVDQLIHVPEFLHGGFFDVFDPDAADNSGNQFP